MTYEQHLKILNCSSTSSLDDIKKQYRKLAKLHHPDINKSSDGSFFNVITISYNYLLDNFGKPVIEEIKQTSKETPKYSYKEPKMEWTPHGFVYKKDISDIKSVFDPNKALLIERNIEHFLPEYDVYIPYMALQNHHVVLRISGVYKTFDIKLARHTNLPYKIEITNIAAFPFKMTIREVLT